MNQLWEIIPPRENRVDALGMEMLFGSLRLPRPFALEIAGNADGLRFGLRADDEDLPEIARQFESVYENVIFRRVLSAHDAACAAPADARASGLLLLRRPPNLPLRTFRDGTFRETDPVRGLLAALSGMKPGERALTQLVLKPAPSNWSDLLQVPASSRADTPNALQALKLQLGLAAFLLSGACLLGAVLQVLFLWHRGLSLPLVGWLAVVVLVGALVWGLVARLLTPPPDPKLVARKTSLPACDVAVRLVACAPTSADAEARLRRLVHSYAQFDLANGNAFVFYPRSFDPANLAAAFHSRRCALFAETARLNVAELASLWHLPLGTVAQPLERSLSQPVLARRALFADGVLVGHSQYGDERIPVHLDADAFNRHMLLVAKTQKGKSTLMAHLAHAAMQDAGRAVIVIDPHGDLARTLAAAVPAERLDDALYLDFGNAARFVGLNVLDTRTGRTPDKIVADLVHVGTMIWGEFWGPRMEDILRMALLTLLETNLRLVAKGKPQFTLLDVPGVLINEAFRNRLLREYVTAHEIRRWWLEYFDSLSLHFQNEMMNPVLTKIHRFTTHTVLRGILGQSDSTLAWERLLVDRRILLVNTAHGTLGADAAGLLGAVLLDWLNLCIREQAAVSNAAQRPRATVLVDEFHAIPGVDYGSLLAELQKMGGSFVLGTQSLAQLEERNRALPATVLSNIDTLFVFQVSAADAKTLAPELDDRVRVTDIINQPAYTCYVKTQRNKMRLPVLQMETLSPLQENSEIAKHVLSHSAECTRTPDEVRAARDAFVRQWFGAQTPPVHETNPFLNLANAKIGKESEAKGLAPASAARTGNSEPGTSPSVTIPVAPRRQRRPRRASAGTDEWLIVPGMEQTIETARVNEQTERAFEDPAEEGAAGSSAPSGEFLNEESEVSVSGESANAANENAAVQDQAGSTKLAPFFDEDTSLRNSF